jgi:deoxyribonuclease V
MGDAASTIAIREALKRPDFKKDVDKVRDSLNPFTSFQTTKPLFRLAKKQEEMAKLVIERDTIDSWKRVGGVDAAYYNDHVWAACVVVDQSGRVVAEGSAEARATFPYIPSYFYWREGPALAAATRELDFDILMVNAQGIAHPRRLGLASQLGLELGKPTIGVSRRLLVGDLVECREGEDEILLRGIRVGMRLDGNPPLIVSVGHMISLKTAVSVVRGLWTGKGLPRPLALAHCSTRCRQFSTTCAKKQPQKRLKAAKTSPSE